MANEPMKPMDVGAATLIPQGNLSGVPGSYSAIKTELDAKERAGKTLSRTSQYPSFAPGYTTKGLEGDWECTTIK